MTANVIGLVSAETGAPPGFWALSPKGGHLGKVLTLCLRTINISLKPSNYRCFPTQGELGAFYHFWGSDLD